MKDFSVGYRRCRFFYQKCPYKSFKIRFHNFRWYHLVVGGSHFVFEIRSKKRHHQNLPWVAPDGVLRGEPLGLTMRVWESKPPYRITNGTSNGYTDEIINT